MIQKIFPYKLQLHILQLEEYHVHHFIKWITKNYFKRSTENKKILVWTVKAKLLLTLSFLLNIFAVFTFTLFFKSAGLLLGLILTTQPYLFLIGAVLLVRPYEEYVKYNIKQKTIRNILSLKKLRVIGITGSYGKTSTKEFLYTILKQKYSVLKTPESYNTILGIAKVVDLELDETYDYFICEMGAYKRGDIKELCSLVNPTYGILTGINEQHILTFGSIQNTVAGKFELIDFVPDNGIAVVNIDNKYIEEKIKEYTKPYIPYGFSAKEYTIKDIFYHTNNTVFTLVLNGHEYKAETQLIGNSNLQNILAAATAAYHLGMKPAEIIAGIAKIQAVPHRLEIKELDRGLTIIDDAYNSNVTGFKEAVSLLKYFKNRPKVIVTPGIVDLGKETSVIHHELGSLIDEICDYVYLVGRNERTIAIESGMKNTGKIIYLHSLSELWDKLAQLNLENPVVLLENDLPDNY
jgi:UDP-N-acetylmuramoyl-tripeptide--D-alanyl-D-alanine ligase